MQSQIVEEVACHVHRALQEMVIGQGQCVVHQLEGNTVPTGKSSQAFLPDDIGAARHPVDEISDSTVYKILLRLTDDVPLEAATGMAYPCKEGNILHGTPMEPRNTKVSVDSVNDSFKLIPLKFPPNDEVTLLGQDEGSFI